MKTALFLIALLATGTSVTHAQTANLFPADLYDANTQSMKSFGSHDGWIPTPQRVAHVDSAVTTAATCLAMLKSVSPEYINNAVETALRLKDKPEAKRTILQLIDQKEAEDKCFMWMVSHPEKCSAKEWQEFLALWKGPQK